ncbi:MAG: beta-lactamase family protein [Xanthobacteraceae bacterium]|nr:beta-lactamase family protein [Xanthobacteraceae bacterium]
MVEDIEGYVDPGFEPVRDAFAALNEPGGALTITVDGEPVVDVWTARNWKSDSLVHVFSATKPIVALCVLRLVEAGKLALDDRVTTVWPEFGTKGKEATTVRQLLAHQAGVVAFAEPQPLELVLDWDRCVAQIANERPAWLPGAQHGESALLYGHLLGELVRRLDGRHFGTYFREEIAEPLQIDIHIGIGGEVAERVVDVEDTGGRWRAQMLDGASNLQHRALENPPGLLDTAVLNSESWRRAEIPGVNGHASARGLARLHGALADGGALDGIPLVGPELLNEMLRVQGEGVDQVFGGEVSYGLGMRLDGGPFESAEFGYGGIGGSIAFGNRSRRLSFAFVTRCLGGPERAMALERALLKLI